MVKKILILGAGFAGLKVAMDLSKKADSGLCKITLVDKDDVHVYTPDLYEIASSFRAAISDKCLTELKETVATKICDIIDCARIKFIRDEVLKINPKKNEVVLKKQKIKYDLLVVALGSLNNTYGIPGLEQFSYSVKTVHDAIVINCHLDTYFQNLWRNNLKKNVVITVGGGGATGVEFSGELVGYVKFLCEKYKYPVKRVAVQIIQGSKELIGMGRKVSDIARKRLESKGVKVRLNSFINKVGPVEIELKSASGKISKTKSDMLIWTGGVKANTVEVDKFMRSKKDRNVFAAGDNALLTDLKTGKRFPMLASYAFKEGELVAENLLREMRGKKLLPFKPGPDVVIIPVAGKFGILKYKKLVISGKIAWYARRFVDIWYCVQILPLFRALKKWRRDSSIFVEND